jgi:uncharacterized protein (TIGR02147 family)
MRSITDFTDYRAWIKYWLKQRPQRSQNALAARVGVSGGFVSMVLAGERAIAVDDAPTWGRAMKLEGTDLKHFVAMVRAAHGSQEDRGQARREIRARRAFERARRVSADHPALGQWYTWAIVELGRCDGFRADPEWIAGTLVPRVAVEEVRAALDVLVILGLLAPAADGALRTPTTAVTLIGGSDRAHADRARRLHQQHLEHARTVLEFPRTRRHSTGVLCAVPTHLLPEIGRRIEESIREAIDVAREQGPCDGVAQVTLQILPRSGPIGS